jgi:hypothetical protein
MRVRGTGITTTRYAADKVVLEQCAQDSVTRLLCELPLCETL